MNPLFQQLMGDVTRLTLAGDLGSATAALQEAMGRMNGAAVVTPMAASGAAAKDADWVIDVAAREVPDHHAAPDVADAQPAPRPVGSDQFVNGTHVETIGTRDYKLYVPPNAHAGQPLPLVVMLHGCTQDPDDFAAGTGMNELARADGFFVLYPAQAQNANPQRCWNWFKHNHQQRDRGEPAMIANMTREVMQQHGIDPKRVYVAGLSAGGAMAAILGETYPDLYAAVGVHSGLPVGSATDVNGALMAMQSGASGPGQRATGTARPAPTIVFHGDRDTTVHPLNGAQIVQAVAPGASAEQDSGRAGQGHTYTRRQLRNAQGRVVAEHWVVHGSGHAWSGGRPQGSYTDARGPDASREMLRFFKTNARQ